MSVQFGPYRFDTVDYDGLNDVLYLGEQAVADGDDPAVEFMYRDDTSDEVVGAVVLSPRYLLEQDGPVFVSLPDGSRVDARPALAAACS